MIGFECFVLRKFGGEGAPRVRFEALHRDAALGKVWELDVDRGGGHGCSETNSWMKSENGGMCCKALRADCNQRCCSEGNTLLGQGDANAMDGWADVYE